MLKIQECFVGKDILVAPGRVSYLLISYRDP